MGADQLHCYYAFGMKIHAEVEFPELQPYDSETPDLLIRRRGFDRPMPGDEQAVFEFDRADPYLGFGGIGQFCLDAPGIVGFEPGPGADATLVNLVLLGVVMATVLYRRGLLTMHASGIDIGGRGVVFMGNKGAGKSTAAAAFIAAGHRLLTDDVLPIEMPRDGRFRILPGFPQLKLADDASRMIELPEARTTPIGDFGFNKSRLRLAGSFSAETVPPAMFYILAAGSRFEAMPVEGAAAMAALMANAYHARYGAAVFHGAAAAAHMRQCAALANAVPIRMLTIPRELDRLTDLVRFVEHDVGRL